MQVKTRNRDAVPTNRAEKYNYHLTKPEKFAMFMIVLDQFSKYLHEYIKIYP